METAGIYISGTSATASPETVEAVAAAIATIFKTAFETHMDQDTIQQALGVLTESAKAVPGVQGTSMTSCTVTQRTPVRVAS